MAAQRKSFLDMPPPPNYIAGLGRGAVGFTTRSDLGPGRQYAPVMPEEKKEGDEGGDDENVGSGEGDEWNGPSDISFADPSEGKEDDEADEVFRQIDDRIDSRRRNRREKTYREQLRLYRKKVPKIRQQFADLKKGLEDVSTDEWDSIPEIGDRTVKRRRKESYVPVPDSLLERARQEAQATDGSISVSQTPGTATQVPLLRTVSEARGQMVDLKLKAASSSVSGQTVVDPTMYISGLNSMEVTSGAEISDIRKARLLLRSVTQTNPKHAPGWIAGARLEEKAGRIKAARNFIMEGCDACPDSEDVWLEASILLPPDERKSVVAKAIKRNPQSVKLWLRAVELESIPDNKKKVVRKGLEFIPNSVILWKTAVDLESEVDDARILLSKAVECVPDNIDLWLALAKLETYENARAVLNQARESLPTEALVWVAAAQLEEANGNMEQVDRLIDRGVKTLTASSVVIDRKEWIKYADESEDAGFKQTCTAVVKMTIGFGVDDEDRKHTWVEDAEDCMERGKIETARSIFSHCLSIFPGKKSVWLRAAYLERVHGTKDALDNLLKRAVGYCPQAEILWLMAAKEKWLTGDVDAARTILGEAFAANPDSEKIWLAAIKLESENTEFERARTLAAKARERASTTAVWIKSAKLERQLKDSVEEKKILTRAVEEFSMSGKLWLMLIQWEKRFGTADETAKVISNALERCPKSVQLWLEQARQEEAQRRYTKTRYILEKARFVNPKTPELWLESIRFEQRVGNEAMSDMLLAKALQTCPSSGLLLAESIARAPKPKKKSCSIDALKKCDTDPHVLLAVARFFWTERKIDKSRSWFKRAALHNPTNGDVWATWMAFEKVFGSEEDVASVRAQCVKAQPRDGLIWKSIRKDPEFSTVGGCSLSTEQILDIVVEIVQREQN